MAYKVYETDEIISDEEFEEECTECICFSNVGIRSLPCNGERCDCPYFGEIEQILKEVE